MTKQFDWKKFAAIYNDVKTYPNLIDVGVPLGLKPRSVRERAENLRKMREKDQSLPELIYRSTAVKQLPETEAPSEREIADNRAANLGKDLLAIITRSKYPVINPEAVVVESYMPTRWDRDLQDHVPKAGSPRTWISDTLRVAPIKNYKRKTFLFTGAQNDAELHPIWDNLKAYAEYLGAQLVVGPGTYETQWWSENNPLARSYEEELWPYLCFGQMAIGDQFVFCGEMNILPTASSPISDLVTYTRGRWGVFPHAKRQLKSVPSTDPNRQAHQVMTTGLCTRSKVIPRKAGIKSIFHAVAGATIVEFDADGDIFCRQITAGKDGSFYDLNHHVAGGVVTKAKSGTSYVRAVVLPDLHERKLGPVNAAALMGIDLDKRKPLKIKNVLDDLHPQEIFVHDLFDNEWGNHHHKDDAAYHYELAYAGRNNVIDELYGSVSLVTLMRRAWMKINVVESNHDLALERYVREGRYRDDGKNMRLGLQLEDAYLEARERQRDAITAHKSPPKFSVLEHAMRKIAPTELADIQWIYDGTSYKVDGVECGHHGFRGANGAKGTVNGFAKIGAKMSIGDKHSPEINEGVYVAGVAELQHGYNKGPSGWAVTLIAQYVDGKRTLITLQNGKFRA